VTNWKRLLVAAVVVAAGLVVAVLDAVVEKKSALLETRHSSEPMRKTKTTKTKRGLWHEPSFSE